jgi:hypothetical protein
MKESTHTKQQGSVLLLVLILSGLFASLALGFRASTTAQLETTRLSIGELHADLALQSGLEHAQRRLTLDPDWQGMNQPLYYMNSSSFLVKEEAGTYRIQGDRDLAHAELSVQLQAEAQSGIGDKALVALGGAVSLEGVHITGELVLADAPGSVLDWEMNAEGNGSWVPGGASAYEDFLLTGTHITDTLWKFTDTTYLGFQTDEQKRTEPVRMPAWDLDTWLIPGNDRVIFQDVTLLEHQTLHKTAVFRLKEGETLSLKHCRLLGGVVIWAPKTYELRQDSRNTVQVESCHIGNGALPHVGLLAPAAKVKTEGGGSQYHGLCFWNALDDLKSSQIIGILIVVNEIDDLRWSQVVHDPQTGKNPPEGVLLGNAQPGASITELTEHYADVGPSLSLELSVAMPW